MTPRRARGWAARVVAATTTLVLTACAGAGPAADPEPPPPASLVESARDGGAGPDQLAELEDDVTYAEYETAMNRAFECMRAAGLAVTVTGTGRQNGTTVLRYTVSGTTAATDLAGSAGQELQDACYVREARFVDMFWQTQSEEALAWSARQEAALAQPLRDCLVADGTDVPGDASFLDLVHAASDLTARDPSSDCMGDIGYSSWDG